MWTVLLMWSHPSSLSLCHSFLVPLPITFTPILRLTSIPGPASRSASGWTTGMHDRSSPAHRTHSDEFLSQVRLISTVEQNPVTSGSSSDAQPLYKAHSHPPILEKGVVKSDYYAHRLQLPVSPSKTWKISAPLSLLSSPTSNYYHHYTKKWVSFGWFVYINEHSGKEYWPLVLCVCVCVCVFICVFRVTLTQRYFKYMFSA